MYEFIRGPMAWACFSILVGGMIFQAARFFIVTKKIHPVRLSPPDEYPPKKSEFAHEFLPSIAAKWRVSIAGVNPVMTAVTVVFHTSIIILPLFLLEHHMLMDALWGVSFCPYVLSETNADILAGIVLSCILFFLLRRIFIGRVRSISTFYDYFILLLTVSPFVTGILAVHDLFDYKTLIILHVLSVNIIMISLPFTKMAHSLFFFLNRFFIGSETGFAAGSRKW